MIELIREQLFQHQLSVNMEEVTTMDAGNWPPESSLSSHPSLYGDEWIQESLSDVS
jgi:hypothetical protein